MWCATCYPGPRRLSRFDSSSSAVRRGRTAHRRCARSSAAHSLVRIYGLAHASHLVGGRDGPVETVKWRTAYFRQPSVTANPHPFARGLCMRSGAMPPHALKTNDVERWALIVNPAFASPSAIRRTSSWFLNGCRAKCSLKEYLGLISLSSLQMRRASSPSPR